MAIAEREGISDRQVRRILSAEPVPVVSSAGTVPLVVDPLAARTEAIRVHLEALEELRTLARTARQEAVRVGACRSAVATAGSLISMLERLGLAPSSPFCWLEEQQWASVWEAMHDALGAAGVDDVDSFAADLARRMGGTLGIAGDVQLVGVGPVLREGLAA